MKTSIAGFRVAGVATCVPAKVADNLDPANGFDPDEVRKVVQMAGVRERRVVEPGTTAADLSFEAAENLLQRLGWERDSISGLVFVTQSPDHFLPSSACLLQQWLGLPDSCAAFDVGLGCSGWPYGLYLAAAMLKGGGHRRILMLHGETPSRFVDPSDHATTLLFSDSGSATAVELSDEGTGHFVLHTDGSVLQNLEGFLVHFGRSAEDLNRKVKINNASVSTYVIENLTAGTWYFAVSAFNSGNLESSLSNVRSKVIE